MKVITLHVNVKEQMVTLLQTLPGIKITQRLSEEKKKQFYVLPMFIKITVESTDAKRKAKRKGKTKHLWN